jgi:Kef-type K+ transport system membrane component KefB/nucleotide-binding universal stress UspA family protein
MEDALKPLAGHAVFLLLIQLSLILFAARLGAEFARRIGLPAVVGELAAGIVLGPSVLGHFAPTAFTLIFPHESAQYHLLEVVGSLGMALLLLLTGLETDLRLLKNLGRAALIASGMGMFVPFATGYVLGIFMPDSYLAHPDQRFLFSAFLATAMSISAMPVIAKILLDLDLTKRNIGLVILSAGVVDDTVGWLILSLIAGAASHGEVRIGSLFVTILESIAFLVVMAVAVYPLSRLLMTVATRAFKTPDADLVLLLIVTFLCAAATEHIGIHAAFGAFISGTMFRQVPAMRAETVHRLESFVFPILAPVFFGIVGLKVDLWTLGGGNMLLVVLGVACFGKLFGCTLGGMWGGMRFWEALSIAVAMNARGAMELVVATIGLSLGILNQQMFSIIVVVAITTSFMAPLGLRLTMKKVRVTEDEARRMVAEQAKGVFDPGKVRVLLPSGGGPNTPGAALLVAGLTQRSANAAELMYVAGPTGFREAIARLFRRGPRTTPVDDQLVKLKQLLDTGQGSSVRRVSSRDAAHAIIERARDGFDLIVLGASQRGHSLGGPVLADVVEGAPCHVVITKSDPEHVPSAPFRNVLVPFDGGVFGRVAVELAVRYAEATGAKITIAMLNQTSARPRFTSEESPSADMPLPPPSVPPPPSAEEDLTRISSIFLASDVRPRIVRLERNPSISVMSVEATSGDYDLVVLGAENRAVQHRLFFGYDNERLIRTAKVTIAIVIPNVAFMSKDDPAAIASLQRPRGTPIEGAPPRPAATPRVTVS